MLYYLYGLFQTGADFLSRSVVLECVGPEVYSTQVIFDLLLSVFFWTQELDKISLASHTVFYSIFKFFLFYSIRAGFPRVGQIDTE